MDWHRTLIPGGFGPTGLKGLSGVAWRGWRTARGLRSHLGEPGRVPPGPGVAPSDSCVSVTQPNAQPVAAVVEAGVSTGITHGRGRSMDRTSG